MNPTSLFPTSPSHPLKARDRNRKARPALAEGPAQTAHPSATALTDRLREGAGLPRTTTGFFQALLRLNDLAELHWR